MSDSLELFPGLNNISTGSVEVAPQLINTSGLPSTIEQVSNFSRRVSGGSYTELVNAENAVARSLEITDRYYADSILPNFSTNFLDPELTADSSPNLLGEAQNYFVRQESIASTVDPLTGETIDDSLNVFNPTSSAVDSETLQADNLKTGVVRGTLKANRFTYRSGFDRLVFSGNGNVEFGSGKKDTLDLSNILFSTVKLNLADLTDGGVIYNPGNGDRVFDAITLNNGQEIFFEGIDVIQFADRTINRSITPNDPMFSQQWNLHMMGVHNAWRFTTGSKDVLIGVQDTGIGVNSSNNAHPELSNFLRYGDNFGDEFSSKNSKNSHGTAVQSIISAKSNNGIGMSGINWNSNSFHIDVLGGNSKDQNLVVATQNMIAQANRNNQSLVINMSLGIDESFGINYNPELAQVIENNPNVLFVIAAGNDGHLGRTGIASPAVLAQQYNNVIAVGASWGTTDRNGIPKTPGDRIQYSNWGSQYGTGLTLMGPSEVIAARATKTSPDSPVAFGYNQGFDGTSAAAPNVAGVASLVWSANSNLTASQIKQIMSQTAYDLDTKGYDTNYGHGFVNADAAVRRAMAMKIS